MTGAALRLRLAVNDSAPSAARRALRRWLVRLGWPIEDIDDLVLATNEAVSNAVEHSAPAGQAGVVIRLDADMAIRRDGTGQIVITVVDSGRWQPPPSGAGFRGRGMVLMRAVCESVQFHTTDSGTHIVLVSRPFPARPESLPVPRPPTPGMEKPPDRARD